MAPTVSPVPIPRLTLALIDIEPTVLVAPVAETMAPVPPLPSVTELPPVMVRLPELAMSLAPSAIVNAPVGVTVADAFVDSTSDRAPLIPTAPVEFIDNVPVVILEFCGTPEYTVAPVLVPISTAAVVPPWALSATEVCALVTEPSPSCNIPPVVFNFPVDVNEMLPPAKVCVDGAMYKPLFAVVF